MKKAHTYVLRFSFQCTEDKVQVLCLGFLSGLLSQQAGFPEPLVMQFGLAAAGYSHLHPLPQCFTSLAAGNPVETRARCVKGQKNTVLPLLCPRYSLSFFESLSPAVCIYLNKNGSTGPHLDKKKVQRLPDHFGPARASVVLQQAVQACIDCAHHQKTVFSLLKQGHGGAVVSGERPRAGRPPARGQVLATGGFLARRPGSHLTPGGSGEIGECFVPPRVLLSHSQSPSGS